jgi:hypothetical protein
MEYGREVMPFKRTSKQYFNHIASINLKLLKFKVVRRALLNCGFGLCPMVTMATKLYIAVNSVKLSQIELNEVKLSSIKLGSIVLP